MVSKGKTAFQPYMYMYTQDLSKAKTHHHGIGALLANATNLPDAAGFCPKQKSQKMPKFSSTWRHWTAMEKRDKTENTQPNKRHDQQMMCLANVQL